MSEYMGILNLTGKHIKNTKEVAKSDHLLQFGCLIIFDDFDVLASNSNKCKLLINKSLLINMISRVSTEP